MSYSVSSHFSLETHQVDITKRFFQRTFDIAVVLFSLEKTKKSFSMMISRHDRSNDVKRKENDQIFSFSPVNIGHGIKGKRPLMITNLTSLSPGATGVHSRSSLSNRNQARRNVYMCVCAWRTKKERKNTTTLRMTDDSRSPAVCCSIASEGIYIYTTI
jgi:hypothetical protein